MGKRDKRGEKRDKRNKYMREITPPLCKIPPTRKLSQGTVFTASLKIVVMNVYRWFRRRDHAVSEAAELTASCTGVSRSSVFQFRKEESSPQGLKDRKMTRVRKKLAANSRDVKYDEKARSAIRSAVIDLKSRDISASLNNILGQYKLHPDLPSLTANTLRRLLHDMGYIYKKEGNKHILVEKLAEAEKKAAEKKKEKKPPVVRRKKIKQFNKSVYVDFEDPPETEFDPNMFDSQYLPKTEYMFFQSETNKHLLQQQQQPQHEDQSLQKNLKDKKGTTDSATDKIAKKIVNRQPETTVLNSGFETNIFENQQQQQQPQQQYILPPKTDYMFYDNKQQSLILHPPHQVQQLQLQPQQQQMQQDPQTLVQVQMPAPILPSSINQRDMQILPNTKLMMLTPAQNNVPWG